MNGPTIHTLRTENRKLREENERLKKDIPGVHSKAAWNLVKDNKKLKQRIGELTRTTHEMREEYKMAIGRPIILRRKIENLENLVGVYERRLAKMADRLTDLAAERNQLYLEVGELRRVAGL